MSDLSQFSKSFKSYFEVIPFVHKHKTYLFYVIPLTINLILTALLFWLIQNMTDSVTEKFSQILGLQELEKAGAAIEWLISLIIYLIFFFIKIYIYQYISLLIIAPFLSFLAEQVLNALHGNKKEVNWDSFIPLIIRGLKVTLRIFGIQILSTFLLIFVCKSVPLFLPLLPILLFLVNAYCMGFTLFDYICEYDEIGLKESFDKAKSKTTLLLSNGIIYQLLLMIPILGTMFAPSFALVAMSIANQEIKNEENLTLETK